MTLPQDFVTYTRELFGEETWQKYLQSFEEPAPVSIRLNPFKPVSFSNINSSLSTLRPLGGFCPPRNGGNRTHLGATLARARTEGGYLEGAFTPVPHCRNAYYLSERPNFTLDPLFHAGAYYVQEASSMYLDEIIREIYSSTPLGVSVPRETGETKGVTGRGLVLDLCAAPGGKSTLLRAAIPDDAVLYSNEPDHHRANILLENMLKQGHPRVVVTNNYPRDYQKAGILFDLILTDVPCSGEGMFRKDPATIKEWSVQNVMKCQQLQRTIVSDIWPCLKPGGILIYSTCTFNRHEDEENIEWITENLGAEILMPAKRFIPGIDRGEGLFMAALRKTSDDVISTKVGKGKNNEKALRILSDSPEPLYPLLEEVKKGSWPCVELTRDDALRYLRREALVLPPDTPRGHVVVTYQGLPLGFVKNIGTRANNLYPKEWKIRMELGGSK